MRLRCIFLVATALTLMSANRADAQAANGQEARLLTALQRNRLPLTMGDGRPGGAGWDWLVRQAAGARFALIGEEPGVSETAQLSAALFTALRGYGYSRMAIALSPVIAQDIETAARRNGFQGIVDLLSAPGVFTLYNLREEAQFLADVIKAAPAAERVLWGLDREIFSDRYLISRLEAQVPPGARDAFARLKDASARAWARHERTGNGDDLFLLSGDPGLVAALRASWPTPDRQSDGIMRTLEESLAIEAAEQAGGIWPFVQRRTQWQRDNLAGLLAADQGRASLPKTMIRFGYLQAMRGANYFNVVALGAMADEVAAMRGESTFHVLVLPGAGSRQAVLGPVGTFRSVPSDEVDEMRAGDQRIVRVLSNPNATGHEVIDLRPLRPLAMRGLESWNSDVVRTIHGFDAVVIWNGARASTGLKSSP